MFDTAFKNSSESNKKTVKDMLMPLIKVDATGVSISNSIVGSKKNSTRNSENTPIIDKN